MGPKSHSRQVRPRSGHLANLGPLACSRAERIIGPMVAYRFTRRHTALLRRTLLGVAAFGLASFVRIIPAQPASSAGCDGGGLAITGLPGGAPVGGDVATTISADSLGPTFLVAGRYVEFTVVSGTFGVENWTLTARRTHLTLPTNDAPSLWPARAPTTRA